MRIGSLFSGAGGLDLAVQAVFGGTVVWHAEIDKAASKVLAHHWPDVPNLGDVSDINWDSVPPVDVLCGGFPCQDVSAAGRRAGIKEGTRSGLWSVFAEAIDWLHPRIVVIENVRGLLSAAAERTVHDGDSLEFGAPVMGNGSSRPLLRAAGAVLGDLADLGFNAAWATVAAADIGAPHRRERVFILATDAAQSERRGTKQQRVGASVERAAEHQERAGAYPLGGGDVAARGDGHGVDVPLLPTPKTAEKRTSRRAVMMPHSRSGPSIGQAIEIANGVLPQEFNSWEELPPSWQRGDGHGVDLLPTPRSSDCFGAGQHGDGGMDLRTTVSLLPTPCAGDGEGGRQYGRNGTQINLKGIARVIAGDKSGLPDCPELDALLCTPAASDGAGGKTSRSGRRIDEPLLGGQAREMATGWGKYEPAIRRWENLTRPAPAPTEPNKTGNPRLSAAFSEWLMGWPAGWVTDPNIGISRNDQLRIVGNGVCPQQAAYALNYLTAVAAN